MVESAVVQVQVVADSMADIRDFLGAGEEVPAGRVTVMEGLALDDVRVSRSSGFDGTQYVLEGVMTVVTTVTSGVLTAWLSERLKSRPRVSVTVNGEEVRPDSVPPPEPTG
jgi:hypothetical protein